MRGISYTEAKALTIVQGPQYKRVYQVYSTLVPTNLSRAEPLKISIERLRSSESNIRESCSISHVLWKSRLTTNFKWVVSTGTAMAIGADIILTCVLIFALRQNRRGFPQ